MNGESDRDDFEDLSVPEKILRVQDLWDEIARSPREVELTPAQLEEAERRLREHETNPGTYSTWEEVKRRLENEL
jgi:putative addiction module component (TIGR02574 family)